ncbi:hypothetical protein [Flavobacterium urocaniciphilum]|uniref:Uncharacterized protein n=1 Tax=Flavobacterium urocaniciphilum TaxID=1299341 RepID=A0A1H8Z1F6_9FLAO|nr:hypothetical protein [Flavobacterium urocaniciphilum]SEP58349.1 hypothetical protein SAMN05444005_101432 [Flavobacterium urocaniciphilum]
MYKKIIFLFILLLNFTSCKQKKEFEKYDKNGNPIVYNEEEYFKIWTKDKNIKVTIIDTFCINQKKRALKDIQKDDLIYFRPDFLEYNILSNKLKKYGIKTKGFHRSCLRFGEFEPYCYQDEMYNEICKRFGENFLDSLTQEAKKEFVIKNPKQRYIEDGIDLREKYLKEIKSKNIPNK